MIILLLFMLGVMDICGLSARVLVDSGATHSFISIAFAEKLDRIPISIDS